MTNTTFGIWCRAGLAGKPCHHLHPCDRCGRPLRWERSLCWDCVAKGAAARIRGR